MVTAHASVTIQWNVRAPATPRAAQTAVVRSVNGTHVVMRFADGTTRVYIASPQQARMLRHLVGTAIEFTSTGERR
jgi:hypothetical protein